MSSDEYKGVLSKVVGTVRASSALAAQDVEFFTNLDKDVSNSVKELSSDMLDMINTLMLSIDENCESFGSGKDEIEASWKDFTDLTDNLFEKSDRSLDIINNSKSSKSSTNLQYLDDLTGDNSSSGKRISKPQLEFLTPVDNSESHPFKPLLHTKPNSLKSLENSLVMVAQTEEVPLHYAHPYEYEIDHQEYNDKVLEVREPIPSQEWQGSKPVWIDSKEGLDELLVDLRLASEIAVDLEHHDYRTYYGITCLMQISTREKDYLIDTIALREDLQVLNEIFTNPMILKVFHGAFMDIIWLQRDLGLYVVSLFDTYHASRALGFPKHSLAYLLEHLANFKTSKKYQLDDWRVRPLGKSMTAYAQSDTHFLLNIYDQLRNQLIQNNKLANVLNESRNVAKRRFEYSKYRPTVALPGVYTPIEKENPWKTLVYQYNVPLEKEELLRELYEWRDITARKEDESPRYVMPNQLLISLTAYTPIDPNGVVSVANYVTDTVRSNSKVIANLIKKHVTGSNLLSNTVTKSNDSNVGSNKIMTLSQVRHAATKYKDLARFSITKSSTSNTEAVDSKRNTSIFFGDLDNRNKVISYHGNGSSTIDQETLKKRSEEFVECLQQLDDIAYSIPVGATTEYEGNILEGEKATTREQTDSEQTHLKQPEDDLTEIVVLKQVSRTQRSAKPQQDKQEDVIDYSKEKKVLANKMTGKNGRKQNKRKFDPFSVSNEGPEAAKKKRAGTRGRNVSFKR